MVDPNELLRQWMLSPTINAHDDNGAPVTLVNPILDVFDANPGATPYPVRSVFSGRLPEGYNPKNTGHGIAIVIRVGGSGVTSGGVAHTEMPIIDPRMQVTVWAGNNEFVLARTLDRAIFDWIHAKSSIDFGDTGFVLSSLNQVLGQDITDPSGLATVVSWYHLTLREN